MSKKILTSLPLFEITFPKLDENAQKKWLEKLYTDGDFAFFSVAVRCLDTNSALFTDFAKKAYADEEMAFFSILTDCMDESELELWLDRALEDGNWAFQSMLFDKLNQGEEFDELKEKQEKEWAEAQTAEYQAVGVTMDEKDYYRQAVSFVVPLRLGRIVLTACACIPLCGSFIHSHLGIACCTINCCGNRVNANESRPEHHAQRQRTRQKVYCC